MTELNTQQERVRGTLRHRVDALAADWHAGRNMRRLWQGDESLWTSSGESRWLGWLPIVESQLADPTVLRDFASSVRGRFSHAVLLGMGGSSLCPEVLGECFGGRDGFPELRILDSTDPAQIRECERSVSIESTLFISASKSGSTIETALLTDHFLDRLSARIGPGQAAGQFLAITDPGSRLEAKARDMGFGHLMHGVPEIGGRYSALSHFGMVPAAAMGLDTERLLAGAQAMHSACGPKVPLEHNPGLRLGLLLGAAAQAGRDKLTLIASPGVRSLGTWIEQLVAESTGKLGKGIVPVEGEDLRSAATYGPDRVFVFLSLVGDEEQADERHLRALVRLGHPVVRIGIRSVADLGQEFLRWEIATAVAGAVLGINPFDQPDVESAKVAARELTDAYESEGALPLAEPILEESGIQLFAGGQYAERLLAEAGRHTLGAVLGAHLDTVGEGDYLALLAFVPRNRRTTALLERMRAVVRSRVGVATCVGFGPRFLHSTGQLHKGGADNGVFLQISCSDLVDLAVPGRDLTFGVVKSAQALGDFSVLTRLGRRALRVHLGNGIGDLDRLAAALSGAAG
ncbi:MAG: bifunctional transaldolase/phosoglucose isomerase [Bryobacterales bacterium]|nr:bifunctional transaldolase/phosoglucose isomerase [Bryobacterales bacterium]MDE0629495.1 bifunctional transaldolase/phosoglucose isomerase [Bryobacterales bacterium]